MSPEIAWPAFVEDEDENGQAIPGTRRYAQVPITMTRPDIDNNTPKPSQESPKKSLPPIDIPVAQAYSKADSIADHLVDQNLHSSQMSPTQEERQQYIPVHHPHAANPSAQPLHNFPSSFGNYPVPPFFPQPSPSYLSHSPHYPPHYHPPQPSHPPLPLSHLPPYSPHTLHPYQIPPQFQPPPPPPPQSPFYGEFPAMSYDYTYPPVRSTSRNASRPLASRFVLPEQHWDRALDPITRSASAFGARDFPQQRSRAMEEDGYGLAGGSFPSRKSHETNTETHGSAHLPRSTQKRMEPAQATRLSTQKRSGESYQESDDLQDSRSNIKSVARSRRPSVSFDVPPKNGKVRFEPLANSSRRRESWYDSLKPDNSYVSKLKQASSYLEAVMGPETRLPVNSEISRRPDRQAAKSRSSKSSQSRDECDVKRSDNTRSGSPDESQNMTIKVLAGSARVTLGGAQIDCAEGGAIEIKRDRSSRDNSEGYSHVNSGSRQSNEDQRPRSRRYEKRADQYREKPHSYRESYSDRGYDGFRFDY